MIIKNGFTMDLSNGTEIEIAQIGGNNHNILEFIVKIDWGRGGIRKLREEC